MNDVERIMRTVPKLELAQGARRAWVLFQEAGVMREPDGSTGNKKLDELGSLLDELACVTTDEQETP